MYRVCLLLLLISFSLSALVREEIIEMSKLGLDANVILAGLKKDKQYIPMSKKDIVRMRRGEVDQKIIRYLQKRYRWYQRKYRRKGGVRKLNKQYARRVAAWRREQKKHQKEEENTVQAGFVTDDTVKTPIKEVITEQVPLRPSPVVQSGLSEQQKREALMLYRNGVRFIKEERYTQGIDNLLLFLKTGIDQTSQEYQQARYEVAVGYFLSGQRQMGYIKGSRLLMEFATNKQKQLQTYHFKRLFLLMIPVFTDYPDQKALRPLFLALRDYPLDPFKSQFQQQVAYMLGKYFLVDNPKMALNYLEKVNSYQKLLPSVHYLKSVLYIHIKQYPQAAKELQKLLKRDDLPLALEDIANLAIGRIYYELASRYLQGSEKDRRNGAVLGEAALDAYRSVAMDSPRLPAAFHEAAWTYFVMRDYNRALGQLHALHTPYLKDAYLPDKFILEAGIYVDICHYKYAEEAINTFKKQYHPLRKKLRKYLKKKFSYTTFYEAVNQKDHFLTPVITRVISNPQFHRYYKQINRLKKEVALFNKWHNTARYKALDQERILLLNSLKESELQFNFWLKGELRLIHRELMQLSLKADEIAFEIINAEKRALQQQKKAITAGKSLEKTGQQSKHYKMRSTEIRFTYTGENWLDELSGYRSELSGKCY